MDPNAALQDFLEACRDDDRDRAYDAITNLHDWVSGGGFLPATSKFLLEQPKEKRASR